MEAAGIHVRTLGTGPPVVLVHGTLTTSQQTWGRQEPLAERWTLVIPDRRGYHPSPPVERSDFEADAVDIAALLDGGAHLVGHSYGGMGAVFAAVRRPEAVRSLTLIEAPALDLLRGDEVIEERIAAQRARTTIRDPEHFYRQVLTALGAPTDDLPSPLPPAVQRQVDVLMSERPPWDAPFPLDALRQAGFPMLIVSGGHDDTFERVCDLLADALGSQARRVVIGGRGHVVQRTGQPFNDVLEAFLVDAEAALAPE